MDRAILAGSLGLVQGFVRCRKRILTNISAYLLGHAPHAFW